MFVIQLNCRKENESSFCISLGSKLAMDSVFYRQNWPEGSRILPFNSSTTRDRPHRPQRNLPPRLQEKQTPQVRHQQQQQNTRVPQPLIPQAAHRYPHRYPQMDPHYLAYLRLPLPFYSLGSNYWSSLPECNW